MTADIIETTATLRAYTVPAAVVASVRTALELPDIRHHDKDLAERLVAQKQVTVEDIMRIHTAPKDSGYELRGGDTGQRWVEKIVDGMIRDLDAKRDVVLERHGYDPDTYVYAGITQPDNEDLITQVVRFPAEDTDLTRSEALTASGWKPAVFDFRDEDQNTTGVGLDADLFAFTASALVEDGVYGVLLSYSEPYTFLDGQPLLASAPILADDAEGHVYAIVDATDTTAVMDLIMIKPGENSAVVYRRNGGMWQLDNTLLEAFMSPNPPPIVELEGEAKNRIISQVDANSANQVVTDDEGKNADLGANALEAKVAPTAKNPGIKPQKAKVDADAKPVEETAESRKTPGAKNPPENREKRTPEDSEEGPDSRPPVTAAAAIRDRYHRTLATVERSFTQECARATAWYNSDKGYAEGFSLTAALTTAEVNAAHRTHILRTNAVKSARELSKTLEARKAELENVMLPALVAASKAGNSPFVHDKPGQRQAENLRIYWTKGKGATKIRWGSPGDFTRCVRQLRKYLGARTENYCALRHREMAGMWPGDRRNQ